MNSSRVSILVLAVRLAVGRCRTAPCLVMYPYHEFGIWTRVFHSSIYIEPMTQLWHDSLSIVAMSIRYLTAKLAQQVKLGLNGQSF